LLRICNDALVAHGADADYRQAIAFAHRLGAMLLELRAATSLGRHLRSHDRAAAVWELLVPLYCSFSEAFDTRDLQDAKALLDALA